MMLSSVIWLVPATAMVLLQMDVTSCCKHSSGTGVGDVLLFGSIHTRHVFVFCAACDSHCLVFCFMIGRRTLDDHFNILKDERKESDSTCCRLMSALCTFLFFRRSPGHIGILCANLAQCSSATLCVQSARMS